MCFLRAPRGLFRIKGWLVALRMVATALALLVLIATIEPSFAQIAPAGILAPGDAAVTGFSGAPLPAEIAPGVDPAAKTYIDLGGPSLRVIDLQDMAGHLRAQLVPAPKPYTVTAAQVGQVFGVALDNTVPPNIYVAASSAYGLPIVVPDEDADEMPERVIVGTTDARFMPGLFGPAVQHGQPGSIWKIDGVSGAVSLFANVVLNGKPNSGPALGGLAYDPDSNSLFVADRATGMIHHFGMDGSELGHYDHGVDGRNAQGLPPVPYDPATRLDITSPDFNSEQLSTWGYAPPERLIFGLGIRAGRLYYAVAAGLRIWSVGLQPDGSFGNDATIEVEVPPGAAPSEISKITFDERGRMFLAERPEPTGAYDFEALTQEGVGRVLRYEIVDNYPGAPRIWQPAPAEYAIGFPLDLRNDNGGVAIGYDYNQVGQIDRGSCGGFLWSTGEQLRKDADPQRAALLRESGPLNVDGLQGNRVGYVRPLNVPPFNTYFIDYDDRFDDDAARGHLGDIAIWRVCGPVLKGSWMPPGWMYGWWEWNGGWEGQYFPPHNLECLESGQQPGFQCCPNGSSPDVSGQCKPWCPNGAMDANSQYLCGLGFDAATYDPNDSGKLHCIGGAKADPLKGYLGCIESSPVFSAEVCQAGWSKQKVPDVGTICVPTEQQLQCGPGQQVSNFDNQCHKLCLGTAWPVNQCCGPDSNVSSTGKCCPPGSNPDPNSGACNPPSECSSNQISKVDSACCPAGLVANDVKGGCCPAGQTPDPDTGACKPPACTPPGILIKNQCCSPDDQKPGGKCAGGGPESGPGGKKSEPGGEESGPGGKKSEPGGEESGPGGKEGGEESGPGGKVTGPGGQDEGPGGLNGVTVGVHCSSNEVALPGGCCDSEHVYEDPSGKKSCCSAALGPQGQCCLGGYAPTPKGACCLSDQVTPSGLCCPDGQKPGGPNNDQCVPTTPGWASGEEPGGFCCPEGQIPTPVGSCCDRHQVSRSGFCCPSGQPPDPTGKQDCKMVPPSCDGTIIISGECCPPGQATAAGPRQICCPAGQKPDDKTHTQCVSPTAACAAGFSPMPDGNCCKTSLLTASGQCCTGGSWVSGDRSHCESLREKKCGPDEHLVGGACITLKKVPACGPDQRLLRGTCVTIKKQCGPDQQLIRGTCVTLKRRCPTGQRLIRGACVSSQSDDGKP